MITNLFWASQQLIQAIRIESDHNLFAGWRADHESGRGAAFVFLGQVLDGGGIVGNVPLFERDSSLREECRNDVAGGSTRLGENYDFRLTGSSLVHDFLADVLPHDFLDAPKTASTPDFTHIRSCM